MMNKRLNAILKVFTLAILPIAVHSQKDTIAVDIPTAEAIFFKYNYQLLAKTLQVESQKAAEIQAKLYPNPVLTVAVNAFDDENNRAFHVGKTGQSFVQVEQLIVLGGKRQLDLEIAKKNSEIAALELEDLTRNLLSTLKFNCYHLAYTNTLLQEYATRLKNLDELIKSYETNAVLGHISIKDVVRLKSAYVNLSASFWELKKDQNDLQIELQNLLSTDKYVKTLSLDDTFNTYLKVLSADEVISTAKMQQTGFKLLKANKQLLNLQASAIKKSVIPDLNLFVNYDQRSGAFNNEINAGISLPLPTWHRNQGAVKAAQYKVEEIIKYEAAYELETTNKITQTLSYYHDLISAYEQINQLHNTDFDITLEGIIVNFRNRNISILEFLDYLESQLETQADLTKIKLSIIQTAEELNQLVGTKLF